MHWPQVISAGWTLSPLQPEYLEGRPSHQCLVTLVLKMDLGGWLSSGTGSFMAALLGPFMSTPLGASVRNAFLQPLLMSVISLRDKVPPPLHHCCAPLPPPPPRPESPLIPHMRAEGLLLMYMFVFEHSDVQDWQTHLAVCLDRTLASLFVLQVEQARFMAPPFTLKEAVPSEEEEQHQQPQMQQPRKAEPPQQGGTRSLLADLRYSPPTCSSQLHLWFCGVVFYFLFVMLFCIYLQLRASCWSVATDSGFRASACPQTSGFSCSKVGCCACDVCWG